MIFSSAERLWRRFHPIDFQRDFDDHHALAVFVHDLDHNLMGITLRQAIPSDLGRSGGGLAFGSVKVVEPKALLIRDESRFPRTRRNRTEASIFPKNKDELRFPA
jgi:hypothetical protein